MYYSVPVFLNTASSQDQEKSVFNYWNSEAPVTAPPTWVLQLIQGLSTHIGIFVTLALVSPEQRNQELRARTTDWWYSLSSTVFRMWRGRKPLQSKTLKIFSISQQHLGQGVVQYSIDINFTLSIMPQRDSYYHHTFITAQVFNACKCLSSSLGCSNHMWLKPISVKNAGVLLQSPSRDHGPMFRRGNHFQRGQNASRRESLGGRHWPWAPNITARDSTRVPLPHQQTQNHSGSPCVLSWIQLWSKSTMHGGQLNRFLPVHCWFSTEQRETFLLYLQHLQLQTLHRSAGVSAVLI